MMLKRFSTTLRAGALAALFVVGTSAAALAAPSSISRHRDIWKRLKLDHLQRRRGWDSESFVRRRDWQP